MNQLPAHAVKNFIAACEGWIARERMWKLQRHGPPLPASTPTKEQIEKEVNLASRVTQAERDAYSQFIEPAYKAGVAPTERQARMYMEFINGCT